MTRLQDYARQLTSPMELLGEVFGLAEADLRRLGISRQESRELLLLADAYFGPTSFTRRQRTCRETKHCLTTLKLIEKYVSRVRTQRDAWNLRVELCRLRGPASEIARRAKQRLRELRPRRMPPREGVQLLRRPNGPWTMRITAPSAFLAEFDAALDPDHPLDSLRDLLRDRAGRRTAAGAGDDRAARGAHPDRGPRRRARGEQALARGPRGLPRPPPRGGGGAPRHPPHRPARGAVPGGPAGGGGRRRPRGE